MAKIRYTMSTSTPTNHAERPLLVTRDAVVAARSIITTAPGQNRRSIGVGPAWAFMPVTTTSYQRCPSAPVTTPIVVPVSSRIGPCSMWASKYVPIGAPTGAAPA